MGHWMGMENWVGRVFALTASGSACWVLWNLSAAPGIDWPVAKWVRYGRFNGMVC